MSEYLKCDAKGCDHVEDVERITVDMVDKPCPKCGANLLTDSDWKVYGTVFQPVMDAVYAAGLATPAPVGSQDPRVVRFGYHDGEMTVRSKLRAPQ